MTPDQKAAKRQRRRLPTTARGIDGLRPEAQPVDWFDATQKGISLALHVSPGGGKTWYLFYSVHGRPKRLKLGTYPALSLADARELAWSEKKRIQRDGVDPVAEKRAACAAAERARAETIDALIDIYIERYAKPRKRTWRDDRTMLTREVLPTWKGRPVTSITRRDCRELLRAIADRGAPIYANRVFEVLRKTLNFAVDEEIIQSNPAARLTKPGVEAAKRPEGEREAKSYNDDEVRRIWSNTEALPATARAPIRMGLVTAQRPTECSDLECREISGSWWSIPGRRTKNGRTHRVFLTPFALEVLHGVPRVEGERFAFAGRRGKRQLAEANVTAFDGVRRREKPRHALRHTAATNMAKLGVSKRDRAKLLNHTDDSGPSITEEYDEYEYDKEKRLALTKWARRLQQILDAHKGAKVVSIAAARRPRHAPLKSRYAKAD
ncbi:MAG: tyrosine-type recombinase/integrase [Vicinamibacteraceae bacterium]